MATRNPRNKPPAEELEDFITAADSYAEYLEELGDDGASVTIFRFPKSGKDMEWCDTVTIDQAGLDIVREKYGPGKYRLTFKRDSVYIGNKTIKIADVYKPNGAPPPANGDSKRQEFMETLLLSIVASMKPAPPPDVGGLLAGIGSMMQAQKPVASADPAAMLTAMATVFTQLNPKRDTLEEVSKIVEIANGLKPDGGGKEESLLSVGKELGEKIINAFAGRSSGAVATVSNGAPSPRPALPPGATPIPPQQTQEEIMLQWLRAQLAFLKEKARAGKTVDDWIDYTFENQEEQGCAAILEAVDRGATFQNLLQFDPEIAQNPQLLAWFEKFYQGIYDEIKKPVDSARTAGNSGDAGNNAETGSGGSPDSKSPGAS